GNIIGFDPNGNTPAPNSVGVMIANGAVGNTIGTAGIGFSNVIGGGPEGVVITSGPSTSSVSVTPLVAAASAGAGSGPTDVAARFGSLQAPDLAAFGYDSGTPWSTANPLSPALNALLQAAGETPGGAP